MNLKRLFGSITVGGLISAVIGYVIAHADPVIGAAIGALGGAIGASTHQVNTRK